MLLYLANAPDFERFLKSWQWRGGMAWIGGQSEFNRVQDLVREIWRGEESGAYVVAKELGLGISPVGGDFGRDKTADEPGLVPTEETRKRSHIYPDWGTGTLIVRLLDLNEHVWMTLLHESRRLAVCRNSPLGGEPAGECPTPYFLKYRPQQEFCSEKCAGSRQKESKRRWWKNNGKQWLDKRRKTKAQKSSAKRSTGE